MTHSIAHVNVGSRDSIVDAAQDYYYYYYYYARGVIGSTKVVHGSQPQSKRQGVCQLEEEDMEQANVMLAVRPQTEDMCEAQAGEYEFEGNNRLQTLQTSR